MRESARCLLTAAMVGCTVAVVGACARQPASDVASDVNEHFAIARDATAGCQDAQDLFDNLCGNAPPGGRSARPGAPPATDAPAGRSAGQPRQPRAVPEWSEYHAEPVQVFDNLYFIGSKRESSWAIATSDGLIILDTLSAYAAEDEIWNGLKKLGFDPATDVKIILLSHGHADHYGGAKFLQDNIPGVRVYLTAVDWDLMEQGTSGAFGGPKPTRDQIVTDGMNLTLGDTTLELHLIPGHTPGNTSALIPVKDGTQGHVAMYWGGTALQQTGVDYFRTYAASVAAYRPIVAQAGADVILGGHPHRDGSNRKIPLLADRTPGDPHPYVIGPEGVDKVLTVISECAAYKGDLAEADEANK